MSKPEERTMAEKEWLRAIGYCRVANANQGTDQELRRQQSLIERFAILRGWELVHCFDEVGKAGEAIEEACEFCKEVNDISYLVVYDYAHISSHPEKLEAYVDKFLRLEIEVIRVHECPLEASIYNMNKASISFQQDG